LSDWLHDPYVQSGAIPFAVALVVAVLLRPLRLAGLAAGAGFAAAVAAIGNFGLQPLSASRKLVVLVVAAALVGAALDLVRAKSGTRLRAALAVACGAAAVWMAWTVLAQKPLPLALGTGVGAAALLAWLAATALPLAADPIRAGAGGLALAFGAGAAAMLGGSALLAQYGIALAAACGAFLLAAVLFAGRATPCAALALTAATGGGLIALGAATLAHLAWPALAVLALVPVAARLPVPGGANAWLRAALVSLYAGAVAGAAIAAAWWSGRGGA